MPATIRLKRVGRKKQSAFRIVVAEKSSAVTGPSIENLGIYQPRTEPSVVRLDAERALHWLRSGAQPTDTVRSIFRRTGLWEKFDQGLTPEELTEKEILLGPPEGQRTTSGRAAASSAAREAAAAEEAEAGTEPSEQEASTATAEPEAEEAEEEAEEPEASAEAAEEVEEESEEADEPDAEAEEEPVAGAEEEPESDEEDEKD